MYNISSIETFCRNGEGCKCLYYIKTLYPKCGKQIITILLRDDVVIDGE